MTGTQYRENEFTFAVLYSGKDQCTVLILANGCPFFVFLSYKTTRKLQVDSSGAQSPTNSVYTPPS